MVALKVFSLEDINEENASVLLEGEHVIGRGALNCSDKRVSRKHAIISICKDLVSIKAIHINPCFFKAAKGGGVIILTKDTSVVLNDGDQFAFLANLFWFKVRITDPNASMNVIQTPSVSKRNSIEENSVEISKRQKTSNDKIDNSKQINVPFSDNVSSKKLDITSTASDQMKTDDFITHENLTQNIDSKKLISSLHTIVKEDYGNNSNKTDEDVVNNNDENITVKIKEEVKIKKEREDESGLKSEDNGTENNILDNNASESNNKEANVLNTDNNTDGNAVGSIKIEASTSDVGELDVKKDDIQNEDENHKSVTDDDNVQNEVQQNQDNTDNGTSSNANINGDKASCSTTKNDDSNKRTRRERCWYGPSCYRKNPIHRVNFSHPGDNDYDTDPDDDRPQCPFGAICYRKNLEHRRQYKHSNPPAPKPSKINLQVNVNSSCLHCPHCNTRRFQKPDYESDYDSDY